MNDLFQENSPGPLTVNKDERPIVLLVSVVINLTILAWIFEIL